MSMERSIKLITCPKWSNSICQSSNLESNPHPQKQLLSTPLRLSSRSIPQLPVSFRNGSRWRNKSRIAISDSEKKRKITTSNNSAAVAKSTLHAWSKSRRQFWLKLKLIQSWTICSLHYKLTARVLELKLQIDVMSSRLQLNIRVANEQPRYKDNFLQAAANKPKNKYFFLGIIHSTYLAFKTQNNARWSFV